MKVRIASIVVAVLGLCSCEGPQPWYAPPAQRPSFEDRARHPAGVVDMSEPGAPLYFVRDIAGGADVSWRWTGKRPAVRFRVGGNENLKYTIDFTLPEATFKDTGPVTIAFTVNDHVLDRVRYARQGRQHFEEPVPPEWIEPDEFAVVGAEIDKVWTAKGDGAQLGFILSRIGLTK